MILESTGMRIDIGVAGNFQEASAYNERAVEREIFVEQNIFTKNLVR